MASPQHDLVSIANPRLANRLRTQPTEESLDSLLLDNQALREQTWRAILILNLMRYVLALALLLDRAVELNMLSANVELFTHRPTVFFVATVTLLLSAIAFSYLSKVRKGHIEKVLGIQFFIDLVLITTLIHISGMSSNDLFFFYFIVVSTGSVALTRRQSLGLASAAFIMMFTEQLDATYVHYSTTALSLDALAGSGAILLISAFVISSLAHQIRKRQFRGFVPGGESLESYLIREEIAAIKTTLAKTQGNKTKAAALLGLSFRAFRYKLAKHGLE